MRLIDAIKITGNPFWIPDAVRTDLPQLMVDLGFERGAEIGVGSGQNLKLYCEVGLDMYGIDPWEDDEDYKHRPPTINPVPESYSKDQAGMYRYAQKVLAPYTNCTLIRKTSIDAARDFPDRSLDFVYIDANYSFGPIAMDLMAWIDKIRKDGIIAGSRYYTTIGDYRNIRHVKFIVDAFIKTYEINKWYVIGRPDEEREENERCDPYFSWFGVKPW